MSSAQETTPTIQMVTSDGNYYFDPIGLHIQPGVTVTFKNVSGAHSATSYKTGTGPAQSTRIPDGAAGWNSGILTTEGATFEHTFDVEGTYDYFCIPHKTLGMVGRIVVGEPGGPADGSMPPDGDVPSSGTIVRNGSVSWEGFITGSISGDQSDAPSGASDFGGPTQPLIGAGLLAALAILAGVVYRATNSEGERYRVGSPEWKRRFRGQ